MTSKLTQFVNCKILRNHIITKEDIWVRNGKIVNPETIFFDEKVQADVVIDCNGKLIAPGFIELQINGGFGYDFSHHEHTEEGINVVAKNVLGHGITSFCPTVVTSPKEVYHKILANIRRRVGGKHGATILGVHAEGPFISQEKKGAHPSNCIIEHNGVGVRHRRIIWGRGGLPQNRLLSFPLNKEKFRTERMILRKLAETLFQFIEVYGSLENIRIITLAPEFPNSDSVVKMLSENNIVVSLGHSTANLAQGEEAVRSGATFITHLFNAMLPFHHRDPGLVGLLSSDNIPKDKTIYFGIISDGIHTHPAALRIAYRVHPEGLVLVTDAISALGLGEGQHKIGQLDIEIREGKAFVAETNTLCGSVASMIQCVRFFMDATGCGPEFALEAASLHPAKVLGLEKTKGTLDFGADADFIFLDDEYEIVSTWIAGECVFES